MIFTGKIALLQVAAPQVPGPMNILKVKQIVPDDVHDDAIAAYFAREVQNSLRTSSIIAPKLLAARIVLNESGAGGIWVKLNVTITLPTDPEFVGAERQHFLCRQFGEDGNLNGMTCRKIAALDSEYEESLIPMATVVVHGLTKHLHYEPPSPTNHLRKDDILLSRHDQPEEMIFRDKNIPALSHGKYRVNVGDVRAVLRFIPTQPPPVGGGGGEESDFEGGGGGGDWSNSKVNSNVGRSSSNYVGGDDRQAKKAAAAKKKKKKVRIATKRAAKRKHADVQDTDPPQQPKKRKRALRKVEECKESLQLAEKIARQTDERTKRAKARER